MAAPTGGPYDVDPPKMRRATPSFNALNVTPERIEIEFDENIKIKSPTEKVIITPPQKNMPVIRSVGKKAIVELKDELLPNTTYTIDFTDAIADNNEENPIENFVYSFSTGDQLDTLSISGKVLNAQDLEPVTGTYVGIHTNFDDTVFTRVPFERISRTDSRGNFTVRGMAAGKYKVFALADLNRDYKYDNPQEAIAFLDSIVTPSTLPPYGRIRCLLTASPLTPSAPCIIPGLFRMIWYCVLFNLIFNGNICKSMKGRSHISLLFFCGSHIHTYFQSVAARGGA